MGENIADCGTNSQKLVQVIPPRDVNSRLFKKLGTQEHPKSAANLKPAENSSKSQAARPKSQVPHYRTSSKSQKLHLCTSPQGTKRKYDASEHVQIHKGFEYRDALKSNGPSTPVVQKQKRQQGGVVNQDETNKTSGEEPRSAPTKVATKSPTYMEFLRVRKGVVPKGRMDQRDSNIKFYANDQGTDDSLPEKSLPQYFLDMRPPLGFNAEKSSGRQEPEILIGTAIIKTSTLGLRNSDESKAIELPGSPPFLSAYRVCKKDPEGKTNGAPAKGPVEVSENSDTEVGVKGSHTQDSAQARASDQKKAGTATSKSAPQKEQRLTAENKANKGKASEDSDLQAPPSKEAPEEREGDVSKSPPPKVHVSTAQRQRYCQKDGQVVENAPCFTHQHRANFFPSSSHSAPAPSQQHPQYDQTVPTNTIQAVQGQQNKIYQQQGAYSRGFTAHPMPHMPQSAQVPPRTHQQPQIALRGISGGGLGHPSPKMAIPPFAFHQQGYPLHHVHMNQIRSAQGSGVQTQMQIPPQGLPYATASQDPNAFSGNRQGSSTPGTFIYPSEGMPVYSTGDFTPEFSRMIAHRDQITVNQRSQKLFSHVRRQDAQSILRIVNGRGPVDIVNPQTGEHLSINSKNESPCLTTSQKKAMVRDPELKAVSIRDPKTNAPIDSATLAEKGRLRRSSNKTEEENERELEGDSIFMEDESPSENESRVMGKGSSVMEGISGESTPVLEIGELPGPVSGVDVTRKDLSAKKSLSAKKDSSARKDLDIKKGLGSVKKGVEITKSSLDTRDKTGVERGPRVEKTPEFKEAPGVRAVLKVESALEVKEDPKVGKVREEKKEPGAEKASEGKKELRIKREPEAEKVSVSSGKYPCVPSGVLEHKDGLKAQVGGVIAIPEPVALYSEANEAAPVEKPSVAPEVRVKTVELPPDAEVQRLRDSEKSISRESGPRPPMFSGICSGGVNSSVTEEKSEVKSGVSQARAKPQAAVKKLSAVKVQPAPKVEQVQKAPEVKRKAPEKEVSTGTAKKVDATPAKVKETVQTPLEPAEVSVPVVERILEEPVEKLKEEESVTAGKPKDRAQPSAQTPEVKPIEAMTAKATIRDPLPTYKKEVQEQRGVHPKTQSSRKFFRITYFDEVQYPQGIDGPSKTPDGRYRYTSPFLRCFGCKSLMRLDMPTSSDLCADMQRSSGHKHRQDGKSGDMGYMKGSSSLHRPEWQSDTRHSRHGDHHVSSGGRGNFGSGGHVHGLMSSLIAPSSLAGRSSQQHTYVTLLKSEEERVTLKHVDNAWKPPSHILKIKGGFLRMSNDEKLEYTKQKIRGLLNKVTESNFDHVLESLFQLNMAREEHLRLLVDMVFEKTLAEQGFCHLYGKLCNKIFELLSGMSDCVMIDGKSTPVGRGFRVFIVHRCQEEFEKSTKWAEDCKKIAEDVSLARMNSDSLSLEEKQKLVEREYELNLMKRRALGNVRFVGELYINSLISEKIIWSCVDNMLESSSEDPEEEKMESLCKLISTIGPFFTHDPNMEKALAERLKKVKQLTNSKGLNLRIRFMLMDLLDLSRNNWVGKKRIPGAARKAESRPSSSTQFDADEFEKGQGGRGGGGGGYGRDPRMYPAGGNRGTPGSHARSMGYYTGDNRSDGWTKPKSHPSTSTGSVFREHSKFGMFTNSFSKFNGSCALSQQYLGPCTRTSPNPQKQSPTLQKRDKPAGTAQSGYMTTGVVKMETATNPFSGLEEQSEGRREQGPESRPEVDKAPNADPKLEITREVDMGDRSVPGDDGSSAKEKESDPAELDRILQNRVAGAIRDWLCVRDTKAVILDISCECSNTGFAKTFVTFFLEKCIECKLKDIKLIIELVIILYKDKVVSDRQYLLDSIEKVLDSFEINYDDIPNLPMIIGTYLGMMLDAGLITPQDVKNLSNNYTNIFEDSVYKDKIRNACSEFYSGQV